MAAKSAAGRCRRQWSTRPFASYAAMAEAFSTEAQNLAFSKIYAKDKAASPASAGVQAALRAQVGFNAGMRRAVAVKMATAGCTKPRTPIDQQRDYVINNGVVAATLARLGRLPTVSPQQATIDAATGGD